MRPSELLHGYLSTIHFAHASGQANPEVSYYPALANLFDGVGATLKPRVHCVINPKNRGAGIPDGGLFTQDQLAAHPAGDQWPGLNPARGAIEAKSPAENVDEITERAQVRRYVEKYGQVLVTNLREFLLVTQQPDGSIAKGERFSLAPMIRPSGSAPPSRARFLKRTPRASSSFSNVPCGPTRRWLPQKMLPGTSRRMRARRRRESNGPGCPG
jgi:hypothetical protein